MRRSTVFAALVVTAVLATATGAGSTHSPAILEFDTMGAVIAPYTGSDNRIRGVAGGGLPWQIEDATGELRSDGALEVEVEGLVLLDAAPVPEALRGVNPVGEFRAIVSCQTIGDDGSAAVENVATGTFPATATGDSKIEAQVELPSPCFAPVVFVTSPGEAWFSVTGI